MGSVFLAEDLKHRRKVAVKLMNPEISAAIGSDRFLREIEAAASLSHPHILPLHDSGAANGMLFYVTPFIEGGTLRQRLRPKTRCGSPARSRARSRTPTPTGSSTATSSPRTCCCPTGWRWSPTSASHAWSAPRRA
jgi:serine/threonine protein kinase